MNASPDISSRQPESRRPRTRLRERLLVAMLLIGGLLVVAREATRFVREFPERRKAAANASLLEAAVRQDVQAASRALAQGAEPRTADPQNRRAMYFAVQHRNLPLIDLLLAAGQGVNEEFMLPARAPQQSSNTPRELVIGRQHMDIRGMRPSFLLHHAIEHRDIEIMQLVLDRGADVELHVWPYGLTPLLEAVANRHDPAVKLQMITILLRHGASMHGDQLGRTPMDMAVLYNDAAAADLLRQHGGQYGPREAVALNRREEVQRMVAEDPGLLRTRYQMIPLAQVPQGLTLLGIALERGYRDLSLQLIEAGAPLSSIESEGSSLLHVAARGGDPELVKLLIDRGLDVNAVNQPGIAPLDVATFWQRSEAAAVLKAAGAKLKRIQPDSPGAAQTRTGE